MLPPAPLVVVQVAPGHLLHPVPLQVHEGCQRQLRPALHRLKFLELVLVEAQRRLEFLEKQLDLPAQRVQLDHGAHGQPQVVRHQDFHVVGRGSWEIFLGCRKDETDLADRVHPSSFLMGVIRPRFRFRPDPMRRQTPIHGV